MKSWLGRSSRINHEGRYRISGDIHLRLPGSGRHTQREGTCRKYHKEAGVPRECDPLKPLSTLQLLDPKIIKFVASREDVYVGGPVGMCPEMVLGELNAKAVVIGEGEEIVSDLVLRGPEDLPGVAYKLDGKVTKTPRDPLYHWITQFL